MVAEQAKQEMSLKNKTGSKVSKSPEIWFQSESEAESVIFTCSIQAFIWASFESLTAEDFKFIRTKQKTVEQPENYRNLNFITKPLISPENK